jgi:hypothetical protein
MRKVLGVLSEKFLPQRARTLALASGVSDGLASALAQTNCRSRRALNAPSRSIELPSPPCGRQSEGRGLTRPSTTSARTLRRQRRAAHSNFCGSRVASNSQGDSASASESDADQSRGRAIRITPLAPGFDPVCAANRTGRPAAAGLPSSVRVLGAGQQSPRGSDGMLAQAGLPPRAVHIVVAGSGPMPGVIFTRLPDGSTITWPECSTTSLPLASRRCQTIPTCLNVPSG